MADDDFQRVRPLRKKKGNICIRIFKKLFKTMYPAQMKKAWTRQGQWLRKVLLFAVFAHCIFFIVALALVGFQTMIIDFILASWSYSVFLTLNECSILIYLCFLSSATIIGLFYGMSTMTANFQVIGLLSNVAVYLLIIYFVSRSYFYFRKNGGIKGLNPDVEVPGSKFAKQAAKIGKKGAEQLEGKIDKAVEQEKQKDLE